MEIINKIIKQTASAKMIWTTLTEFCVNYEDAENFLNNMVSWKKYNELLKAFKIGRKWYDSYITIHKGEVIMFLPLGDAYILTIEKQTDTRILVIKDKTMVVRLRNAIKYSDVDDEDTVLQMLSQLSVH